MRFVTEDQAWKGLCNAIILQACADYPHYRTEAFFRSEWFYFLSRGSLNSDAVIQRLEELKGKKNNRKLFKENLI